MTSQQRMRIVSCPACEHEGAIPKEVPTTATLRCRSCRERWLVREATGPRPCRRRRRTAADLKRRTVRSALPVARAVAGAKSSERWQSLPQFLLAPLALPPATPAFVSRNSNSYSSFRRAIRYARFASVELRILRVLKF